MIGYLQGPLLYHGVGRDCDDMVQLKHQLPNDQIQLLRQLRQGIMLEDIQQPEEDLKVVHPVGSCHHTLNAFADQSTEIGLEDLLVVGHNVKLHAENAE